MRKQQDTKEQPVKKKTRRQRNQRRASATVSHRVRLLDLLISSFARKFLDTVVSSENLH
jgi:hypothetical protein